MIKKKKYSIMSELSKHAAQIKINKGLDDDTRMENAPFFKKKMKKASKMIAIAGLPK